MANTSRPNTAVIGVGNMGKNHARVYSKVSNLVAISDLNQKVGRSLARQYKAAYYSDFRQMIKKEEIDAVSVVVPTKLHYKVVKYCLTNSIPTLVEKPITATLNQASKLLNLSKQNQTYLLAGHVERFNPAITYIKNLIDQNKFGRLVSLLCIRVGLSPPNIKNANVVTDLAIHDIDLCNFLLDQYPQSIHQASHKIISQNQIDASTMVMEYTQAQAAIQTNWITPIKKRILYLTGTKGFAEVDLIKQRVKLHEMLLDLQPSGNFYELITKYESSSSEVFISQKEPLKLELKYFLNNLKSNKPDAITHHAVKALELCQRN